jgi:predicted transcriptional regulator
MAARTGRGNTPARSVRVDPELWRAAQSVARKRGENVSDVIVRALAGYVRRYGNGS